MNKSTSIYVLLLSLTFSSLIAQTTNVQIDMNVQRYIGGVSELDRTKFFTIHDTGFDAEQTKLRNDYNVTGGRGFWGPFSYAKQKTGAVGVYPTPKTGNTTVRSTNYSIATEHPSSVFLDNINASDAADWAVEYYKNFVDQSGRSEFFEVMNEPFVHSKDFYTGGWNSSEEARIRLQLAKFYNEVGLRFKNTPELANMKVIGYSAAYPSMEINNFGHWNDNMKMFMDTAGENMYAFSTHLYDGINVIGQDSKRSGSNSEAILDLIETYSFTKWGTIKPHAISEYGAIESGYGDDYSDVANAQTLRSINHILFNLLDRENRMAISIPFITGKATWHITAANNYQPYGAVLWKPTVVGVPVTSSTVWEYTPRIYFYELWKDVKGKRVAIKSDNPDIQTQAFIDGKKLFVAISNLDEVSQTVNLTMISDLTNLTNIVIKDLKIYDESDPSYTKQTVSTAPNSLTLIKDETIVLEYNFSEAIVIDNALRETNYYTTNHLNNISADTEISYTFNNVTTGNGDANLRLSIGRKHNVSKTPIIKVNGTQIVVPTNWAGYDQANRDDFFGMISIPFASNLLQTNNTITVKFPDAGGQVSSLILTVKNYDNVNETLSVETVSETCKSSNNGQINIVPIKNDTYKVAISGNGVNNSFDFTTNYSINNLSAGTYSLIFSSPNDTNFKEEYTVIIAEPKDLSVQSKLSENSKEINLNLSGSTNYQIDLNGFSFSTSKSNISLPLENGINKIAIKGDFDCQGIFTEDFVIGSEITVYPNGS